MIFLYSFRGVRRCNVNCGDGHEGEKYCILDSQNVETFMEKGIDQVMYLQFQITEFQSNLLILFTNLTPYSF